MVVYLEISGLKANTNGRSCRIHSVCGETVEVGNVLLLQPTIVLNKQGLNEYAISAKLMIHGIESCSVGYICKEFHYFKQMFENKLCKVVELHYNSNNAEHRRRSDRNMGIATCVLLDQ